MTYARKTSAPSSAPALKIGRPDDAFEHEADRAADEVMTGAGTGAQWSLSRMSIAPPLQRKCSCGGGEKECEECKAKGTLQRKASGATETSHAPAIVHDVLHSGGRPLDRATRNFFEPRFGVDFGKVRIHTDAQAESSARDVAARAYTVENRIVFNSGQYSPHTQEGRKLLAHELTHVVQQTGGRGTGRKSPRAVQRKVMLKHAEMKDKERHDFLTAHKGDWGRSHQLASQIMEEMAAAGDSFDFEDDDELKTEIVKRISTVTHMKESQEAVGNVPGHLQKAFGYPFNPPSPGELYGPRVNFAAKDYWTPGLADNYAQRTDKAKNKLALSKSRSDRHTVYGDQAMGTYFWKLTDKGKADPYTAIKTLFVPQPPHKRTLFHCDYLLSVVNLLSLADAIGKDEFNKRIAAYGVDKIVLNWNLLNDLNVVTWLRDAKGEFTSTTAWGLKSTQRVRPGTEKDLVIGDHVIFSNHLAYTPLNAGSGHAWKLENAILIGPHGGKKGNENVYLGHGSGRLTASGMKFKLKDAFNTVVRLAEPWITKAKSSNKKTAAEAEKKLVTDFSVHRVGSEFHVQGKDGLNCNRDVDFKVHKIDESEVPGLRDPCNPAQMYTVERPIESAPGKATP
jgi:hypothetical protein